MPIGAIIAMLMPYIAQLVGQSGNQPTGSSGEMDPVARRLLLGNEPGTSPTGPGFSMDTDPWLMGMLQLQARQQMRLDPLNADIVNLTRRLMPTGLLGALPTEPGTSGTNPGPPPPNPMPGRNGPEPTPGTEPIPQTPPSPNAPPGPSGPGPGPSPGPKTPPQAITASGLDGGIQQLMASLSGSGQGQMNGDGFSLPNWLDQLPQYKKRIGY